MIDSPSVGRTPPLRAPSIPNLLRSALLAAITGLLAAGCGGSDGGGGTARNVVLIVTDTLRADRLQCYGYRRKTSPAISALADEGVVYLDNYAQGCWTVPSMVSLMSGLYVTQTEQQLPVDRVSLAEVLKTAGFRTSAFVGNRVLATDRGFERGFDHFWLGHPDGRAVALEKQFEEWYEGVEGELDGERGFFAWIHPMDPHHPYAPIPRHQIFTGKERVDRRVLLPRWRGAIPRLEELAGDLPHTRFEDAVLEMDEINNAYDGEVLAVDEGVETLLAFLDEKGIRDETLIVFCADHGEMFWEHPHYPLELSHKLAAGNGLPNGVRDLFMLGHRGWYHEEQWNTPLILAGPGIPAGERRDGLVANLDVYPTILDALGVAAPGALHGESLLGGVVPERERLFAYGFQTTAVIETSGLKLVQHHPERFQLAPDAPGPVELFDVGADASEVDDLAGERPEDVRRLQASIDAWRSRNSRDVSTNLSDEALQALADLGYGSEAADDGE